MKRKSLPDMPDFPYTLHDGPSGEPSPDRNSAGAAGHSAVDTPGNAGLKKAGRVQMPNALERKYPSASTQWRRQWVFPQARRWLNSHTGDQGRHHMDESIVQRAVKGAVAAAGLVKRVSCHTFRHSSQRTFWNPATTSGPSRNCSAIKT